MDPIWSNINCDAVGQAILVYTTPYPIASLEDGHLEAVLEKDVCAA
jgi:hypothetical protein